MAPLMAPGVSNLIWTSYYKCFPQLPHLLQDLHAQQKRIDSTATA